MSAPAPQSSRMTMTQQLTKPQADLLLAAVRADGVINAARSQWRTVRNLEAGGLVSHTAENRFDLTVDGYAALADYWMRKDAAGGCLAYALTREEVEAALASARAGAA